MKRGDLVKRIEEQGCVLIRHGAKHDWYRNPKTGVSQPVPRNREIKDRFARHMRWSAPRGFRVTSIVLSATSCSTIAWLPGLPSTSRRTNRSIHESWKRSVKNGRHPERRTSSAAAPDPRFWSGHRPNPYQRPPGLGEPRGLTFGSANPSSLSDRDPCGA